MSSNDRPSIPALVTFPIAIFTCVLVGKSLTSTFVPLILILGLFMFFISFTAQNFAMVLLIFAMLLSPEFVLGAVSQHRNIVVRIDDLFVFTFVVAWIGRVMVNKNLHVITRTPLNMAIGLYIVSFLIPTIKGMITLDVTYVRGLFYVLKYIEYFAIYYLAAGILKNRQQVVYFLKALLITLAIVNIYAITQIKAGTRVSAPFEGAIGEPNTLGGYQVLMMGVMIGLLTHARSLRWKWRLVILTILTIIPFTFTLSRASYAAMIPMYFTAIFFNRRRTRNVLLAVFIMISIVSIFVFPKNIRERVAYTFKPELQETIVPVQIGSVTLEPSASARILDWIRLFEKWKRRPFLGYGVTGAGFVDSQFVGTLVETGLLGLSAFIILLISIGRNTLRIYHSTKDDLYQALALGFFAGHVGMVVHALTSNTFIIIRIMEPYWFLAAIVMMIPRLEQAEAKPPETQPDVAPQAGKLYIRNSDFLLQNGNRLGY